jgi:hypothetical protein
LIRRPRSLAGRPLTEIFCGGWPGAGCARRRPELIYPPAEMTRQRASCGQGGPVKRVDKFTSLATAARQHRKI